MQVFNDKTKLQSLVMLQHNKINLAKVESYVLPNYGQGIHWVRIIQSFN